MSTQGNVQASIKRQIGDKAFAEYNRIFSDGLRWMKITPLTHTLLNAGTAADPSVLANYEQGLSRDIWPVSMGYHVVTPFAHATLTLTTIKMITSVTSNPEVGPVSVVNTALTEAVSAFTTDDWLRPAVGSGWNISLSVDLSGANDGEFTAGEINLYVLYQQLPFSSFLSVE